MCPHCLGKLHVIFSSSHSYLGSLRPTGSAQITSRWPYKTPWPHNPGSNVPIEGWPNGVKARCRSCSCFPPFLPDPQTMPCMERFAYMDPY